MEDTKILIVEDEPDILELICYNLNKAGYKTRGVASGLEALKTLPQYEPNLVVLDWMLPGLDGLELCKYIKQNSKIAQTQVLILTAKDDESDIVLGLESGADDYMTKPFSPKVLNARVKALLRRNQRRTKEEPTIIKVDNLFIHPGKREVRIGEETINLTNMEFRILSFLATHPGWVYTRSQIVAGVRGEDYAVTDRSVDAIIVGLRKKLGTDAQLIETVRGVGYRFKE